jgi:hypothetical protein
MMCRLLFDLPSQGYRLPGGVIAAAAMGALMVWGLWAARRNTNRGAYVWILRNLSLPGAISAFVFFAIYGFVESVVEYRSLIKSYEVGHSSEIEGEVTNYLPWGQNKFGESFQVGGVPFLVSPAWFQESFNSVQSTGSPIHDGVFVKLGYVGNKIIRLEVCDR